MIDSLTEAEELANPVKQLKRAPPCFPGYENKASATDSNSVRNYHFLTAADPL